MTACASFWHLKAEKTAADFFLELYGFRVDKWADNPAAMQMCPDALKWMPSFFM
jgi:hypothetical protein